jgi:hypothetical protein
MAKRKRKKNPDPWVAIGWLFLGSIVLGIVSGVGSGPPMMGPGGGP